MAKLIKGTRRADTAVEECTCYRDCASDPVAGCGLSDWHVHHDEPCARHPERISGR
jgi:hypothetical protein